MSHFRVVAWTGSEPEWEQVHQTARHLLEGGVVAMPTETVYGFGCVVRPHPIAVLQRWKGRTDEKPFLVLIQDPSVVPELVWTEEARALAQVFWPGALTLVLRDPEHRFPPGIRSGDGGVAVRVSPNPLARALVGAVEEPLVSTSVNRPGRSPARSAKEAEAVAETVGAGPELWILDGGPLRESEPSTVVDCTGPAPWIRRAGAIPVYRLRCVLPDVDDPTGADTQHV